MARMRPAPLPLQLLDNCRLGLSPLYEQFGFYVVAAEALIAIDAAIACTNGLHAMQTNLIPQRLQPKSNAEPLWSKIRHHLNSG